MRLVVMIFEDFQGNSPESVVNHIRMYNYYVCNILFTVGYKNITDA